MVTYNPPWTPRVWTSGDDPDGTMANTEWAGPWNDRVKNVMLVGNSVASSIPSGTTPQLLSYDNTVDYDGTGLTYDNANFVITINTSGLYTVSVTTGFAANATGFRAIGAEYFAGAPSGTAVGSGVCILRNTTTAMPSGATWLTAQVDVYLAATLKVRSFGYQTSGAALLTATTPRPTFSIRRAG